MYQHALKHVRHRVTVLVITHAQECVIKRVKIVAVKIVKLHVRVAA